MTKDTQCRWSAGIIGLLLTILVLAEVIIYRGEHIIVLMVAFATVGVFLCIWALFWWCLYDMCKFFRGIDHG